MAFSNTTANVKGPLIQAIALAPPAATFADGVELGMKKPSKLVVSPVTTMMSSGNAWPDCYKNSLETSVLQNDFGTLDMINTYSETYVQVYMATAGGAFFGFVGTDSDSELLMGLEWEWTFKANEDEIKIKLGTELGRATQAALEVEVAPAVTWTSGVDNTKRNRPGVKKVTIGGIHLGALISVEGSVKNRPVMVQLGRALSTGIEATVKVVLAQTSKAEVVAALTAAIGTDTVIVTFWDGVRSLKLTNLLGGKAATVELGEKDQVAIEIKAFFPRSSERVLINTVPGVFELVFLDNTDLS